MLVDGIFHGGKVDMEARIRLDFAADAPRRLDEDAVLGEVGREHDELIPLLAKSIERDGERRRRPARYIHEVRRHGHAEARFDIVCDGFPDIGRARRRRIAVQHLGGHGGKQAVDLLAHAGGRRHAGVAEREIEDVFSPDLGGAAVAVLEDLADDGALLTQFPHRFVQHIVSSESLFLRAQSGALSAAQPPCGTRAPYNIFFKNCPV